jgi:hypothetical protein
MSLLDRNCYSVVELMTALMEQGLPDEDRTLLETHMVWCAGCSGLMAQLRSTSELLRGLSLEPIDERERDQLVASFQAAAAGATAR